jgi:hypothetical protein
MVTRLETVPEAKVLVLCEDGTCRETILHRATFPAVSLSIDYEEPTDVSPELAILDRDRNPIVVAQTESRVERRYPNGKGCDDGTCVNVDLAFNASAETWTLGP